VYCWLRNIARATAASAFSAAGPLPNCHLRRIIVSNRLTAERVAAHELDLAWIIALWLAIHGGDPLERVVAEIDEETLEAGFAFLDRLEAGRATEELEEDELHSRLANAGVHRTSENGEASPRVELAAEGNVVCTRVPGGRMYCFHVPKVTGPPPGDGPVR
jgi:hypothetical protein